MKKNIKYSTALWNYRVGVKKVPVDECFKVVEKYKEGYTLAFFVFSCYYDKEGKPNAYTKDAELSSVLNGWDTFEELKITYSLVGKAFEKPIIDLDNFPNEYKK